jgi:pyridoxine 5-phosphate synthase
MIELAVNIDHIATLRNARGGAEPDPIAAALIAEQAGAAGIVCHLREDRRHIRDKDVYRLREAVQTKLDLEMAAEPEIINIALQIVPELVTIVPEKRAELTTEGGLNVAAALPQYTELAHRMHEKGIEISFFIEPEEKQIEAALAAGADIIELHTGTYAEEKTRAGRHYQIERLHKAAAIAHAAGLRVTAGHGLNYRNILPLKSLPGLVEVSIGHALISRAAFSGIEIAVRDMLQLLR